MKPRLSGIEMTRATERSTPGIIHDSLGLHPATTGNLQGDDFYAAPVTPCRVRFARMQQRDFWSGWSLYAVVTVRRVVTVYTPTSGVMERMREERDEAKWKPLLYFTLLSYVAITRKFAFIRLICIIRFHLSYYDFFFCLSLSFSLSKVVRLYHVYYPFNSSYIA